MLHSVIFNLEGVFGPCGDVSSNRSEILDQAVTFARVAADSLGDQLSALDEELESIAENNDGGVDPSRSVRDLLDSAHSEDRERAVSMISDLLKSQSMGYLDLASHDDLFTLVEDHDLMSWVSPALKARIELARKQNAQLVQEISTEWRA